MQAVSLDSAEVSVVSSSAGVSGVVGPTPHLGLAVEGVQVGALVDSGSQSTSISRSLLHEIAKKLHSEGKELPSLTQPT